MFGKKKNQQLKDLNVYLYHLFPLNAEKIQHGVVLTVTSVTVICGGGEHPPNPNLAPVCSDVDLKRTKLETGSL